MSTYIIYLENLIEDLFTLSNRRFQEVAWFKNDRGLCSSYMENISDLYDAHSIGEILSNPKEVFIDEKTDQAMQELIQASDNINESLSEEEIINDPKMQIVREKAAYVLELIKASDGAESTVDFIKVGTPDTPITIQDAFRSVEEEWPYRDLLK